MAELRTRTLFSDRRLTVAVVESVEIRQDSTRRGGYVAASLKPVAVVVKEPNRTYTVGTQTEPDSVDTDELESLINSIL